MHQIHPIIITSYSTCRVGETSLVTNRQIIKPRCTRYQPQSHILTIKSSVNSRISSSFYSHRQFRLQRLNRHKLKNPFLTKIKILWYPKTQTRLRAFTWIRTEWLYPDSDPSLRPPPLMLQQPPQRRRRLRVRRRIWVRRSENPTLWPSPERAGPSQSTISSSKHFNCKF